MFGNNSIFSNENIMTGCDENIDFFVNNLIPSLLDLFHHFIIFMLKREWSKYVTTKNAITNYLKNKCTKDFIMSISLHFYC